MRKQSYLAVLEPTDDGYGVFYPDFPGCISFGSSIEDAQKGAKEALELHVYGMEKDNEPLPTPAKTLSTEEMQGNIVTSVTIFPDLVKNEMDNKRVKTNVTIPLWLKDVAEANEVNYSKLLELALIEYLGVSSNNSKRAVG